MKSLQDKWILIDKGNTYLVGQVIDIDDDYILVRMRQSDTKCPVYSSLFHISELSCDCRECINSLFFYDEEELDSWIEFVENKTNENNNVVSIDSGRDFE